ncbi:MAG: sulfur carrier protein ThiS [Pyrinomonadaceae bacterium]
MKVIVNGEKKEFSEPITLADLLAHLELSAVRIAVELNHNVVRRAFWAETNLRENDKIEVVHFVGGGSTYFGF